MIHIEIDIRRIEHETFLSSISYFLQGLSPILYFSFWFIKVDVKQHINKRTLIVNILMF